MNLVLMHKNIETAVIVIADGVITEVIEVLNPKHMPVGIYLPSMTRAMCCVYQQAWQRTRAIPRNRINLSMVMETAGMDQFQLGMLSRGMGLTDQYWFRDMNEAVSWEDINFQRNGFEQSSLTLTGRGPIAVTPDYETNGALPKGWVLLDSVPVLIKDSPDWLPTACANEVVASRLAKVAGVAHAEYFHIFMDGKGFCGTPSLVDGDREEFVPLQMHHRTHRLPVEEAVKKWDFPETSLMK